MPSPTINHKSDKVSRQNRYRKSNERLREILARLYAGEVLSMKELTREFGVNLRTIQRDVNERLSHFPIQKQGEKFFIADRVAQTPLDPEDQAVLELLDELSRRQGGAFYAKAHAVLRKLRYASVNPYYAKLYMEDIGDKLSEAARIEQAIRERRRVRCRYRKDSEPIPIEIDPVKIANFEGYWYIIALDSRNGKVKKYLLRKCSDVELTESRFTVPEELQKRIDEAVNVWFEPENDPIEVRLFIDRDVAGYFRLKPISPTQTILGEDRDGSIEVSVTITHPMEIVPIVKYWLPHLRVLEPKEIDEAVRRDIEAYLEE